jgi:hypothetical protein
VSVFSAPTGSLVDLSVPPTTARVAVAAIVVGLAETRLLGYSVLAMAESRWRRDP